MTNPNVGWNGSGRTRSRIGPLFNSGQILRSFDVCFYGQDFLLKGIELTATNRVVAILVRTQGREVSEIFI